MKIKQKVILVASFVVLPALFGVILTPNNVSAQDAGIDCSDAGTPNAVQKCEEKNAETNKNIDEKNAEAAQKNPEANCGDVETSIITNDKICNASGEGGMILAILKEVLKFLTAGVGIAAVGGIGYGALLYTTAENKPEQTKKAIGIITNVVIGIAAYALMYVFLNFLIPGGIFS